MKKYFSTVIIQKEGKWFVARSVEYGVASQGKTIEQAKDNLQEALELYLEDAPSQKQTANGAPLVTTLEFGRG